MNFVLPSGVWPTMITPYRADGKVDMDAIPPLVDWYIDNGVHGLFAVCQSSEMFLLDRKERSALSTAVVNAVAGRCSVIASGHVSESEDEQVADIEAIAATGVDAVVLLSNRFANLDESDEKWFYNIESLLDRINPRIPLGMYECPYPFPKLLSIKMLFWMSDSGRFYFLKDTSCSEPVLKERAQTLRNGPLRLYNANSATLLSSLKWGYAGFSGVMANFHPWLYRWLVDNCENPSENIERIQDFLGFASVIEHQCYPVNAKYHLQLSGVPILATGRTPNAQNFDDAMALTIQQMKKLTEELTRWYT